MIVRELIDWQGLGCKQGTADRDRTEGGATILNAAAHFALLEAWLTSSEVRKRALLKLDAGDLDGADACPLVRAAGSDRDQAFTSAWCGYIEGWPEAGQG